MTIPMPKKEYISIQMTPEHRNRYNILTDALLERQQSDRSYLRRSIFSAILSCLSVDPAKFTEIGIIGSPSTSHLCRVLQTSSKT